MSEPRDARPDHDAARSPEAGEAGQVRAAAARNDRAMRRAVSIAILVGLALDVVLILAALLLAGSPQVLGALIGTALSLVVTLPTLATAHWGARGGVGTMAGIVLGGWLAKMVVLIVVIIMIRDLDGVSMPWVGLALLLGAVTAAVVEGLLLLRGRTVLEVGTGGPGREL